MKIITDYLQIQELENKYKHKETISNNYLMSNQYETLIANGELAVMEYYSNCFLFMEKCVGKRIYYYINNLEEQADFSQYKDLVIEILFRGNVPDNIVNYFSVCGFRINLIRDQYAAMYKDLSENRSIEGGYKVKKADCLDEVRTACELFNNSFDHLSGDFITESDYEELMSENSIIIALASDTNHFLGALHTKMEGKVVVLGHVAVVEEARGRGVGKALVDAFVEWHKETDKTRYQLWVQRQNKAAVNMYLDKGFRYVNKSTISLIK